jgi:hypothetical protein
MKQVKKTAEEVAKERKAAKAKWDKEVSEKLKVLGYDEAEIAALKADPKNKGFKIVHIPLDDEIEDPTLEQLATFMIRRPSRSTTNAMAKLHSEKMIGKGNDVMIKNCVIGGEMDYLEEGADEDIYLSVLGEIGKTVKSREAFTKKF